MAGSVLARPSPAGKSPVARFWVVPVVGLAVLAATALLVGSILQVLYADRIVAGVRVLGLDLGGQTVAAGRALLEANAAQLGQQLVTLKAGPREWQFPASELGMQVNAEAMVEQAYEIGRTGNPLQRLLSQWGALLFGARFATPVLEFDPDRQRAVLERIAAEIDRPAVDARIDLQARDGQVTVSIVPEAAGARLLVSESVQRIREAIAGGLPATVQLEIGVERPALTQAELAAVRAQVQRMVEAPVTLTHEGKSFTLSPPEVAATITFERQGPGELHVMVDEQALDRALARIQSQVGRPAVNARFDWNGGNLRPIREAREGTGIDVWALARSFEQRLANGERTLVLPITITRPAVTSADGPNLGIRELIKEGRTTFSGATAAKAHNIRLAAANLHGTVVPPGELFSFNREVGPTTLDAGYRTGWGITMSSSGARTIPSVAGGICQVATTLFQPVFHAGYQIEERNYHLYWIQSYGQPPLGMRGLDATVDEEAGLDFKFINNTPDYLLIQARVEGSTLIFGLYGTKPSWEVKIEGPVITNVVPADRTPVRQLEPTMPAGSSLQVEAAQDGFDVVVTRTVTMGDDVRRLPLRSHYVPARNVILHGPEPTPEPALTPEAPQAAAAAGQPGPTPQSGPGAQPTAQSQPLAPTAGAAATSEPQPTATAAPTRTPVGAPGARP